MILAIGDSFTYGAELADPGHDAWPAVLGRILNQPVVNLGLTGSSNHRILRLAATNTQQCSLMICAWSDVSRLEVYYQGQELQLSLNDSTLIKRFPWVAQYTVDHYNRDWATRQWALDVVMLQSLLQTRQQRFLFVNAIPKSLPKDIAQHIDDTTFLDKNSSMMDWCQGLPFGTDSHFLEAGHELVAQRLAAHIIDNSLNLHDDGYPVCNKIHRRPRSSCDATHI